MNMNHKRSIAQRVWISTLVVLFSVSAIAPPAVGAQQTEELPPRFRLELAKSKVENSYLLYGVGMGATVATGLPGPALMAVSGDLVVQNAKSYRRALSLVDPSVSTSALEKYARSHTGGLVTAGLGTMVATAGGAVFGYGYYQEDETAEITGGIILGAGAVTVLVGLIIDAVAVTRTRNWVREQHRGLP